MHLQSRRVECRPIRRPKKETVASPCYRRELQCCLHALEGKSKVLQPPPMHPKCYMGRLQHSQRPLHGRLLQGNVGDSRKTILQHSLLKRMRAQAKGGVCNCEQGVKERGTFAEKPLRSSVGQKDRRWCVVQLVACKVRWTKCAEVVAGGAWCNSSPAASPKVVIVLHQTYCHSSPAGASRGTHARVRRG